MQRRTVLILSSTLLISGLSLSAYFWLKPETVQHAQSIFKKKPIVTRFDWDAELESYLSSYVFKELPTQQQTLSDPFGIVVDRAGNLFIADAGEHNRILKMNKAGEISVFAGGTEGYADSPSEGKGNAQFHTPSGLAIDTSGNLYVADTGNHRIRKISKDGIVTTLAGNGQAGFRDGNAGEAEFNGPIGVAVSKEGYVYVADTYNDRIRVISPAGVVTTLAGGDSPGMQDGVGSLARFDTPSHIVIDSQGALIVTDTRNNAVRKILPNGDVSTLISSDPKDRDALLRRPVGLAITHDDHVYVSELSHGRILQIAPDGRVRGLTGVDIDIIPGDDTSPRLNSPVGIAVDRDGHLLVSDNGKSMLHRVRQRGVTTTDSIAPRAVSVTEPVAPLVSSTLWPLLPQDKPHEVVGTIGEVRGNYEGESRDHFHRGVDMQAAMGDAVVAIKEEKVSSPVSAWAATTINEGMRVNKLSYIHMKVGRSLKETPLDAQKFQLIKDPQGKLQQVRVRRGTRFHVGESLGTVNSMYHVHLNYAPQGDVVNPLRLNFIGFQDSVAPQITRIDIADRDGKILDKPVPVRPVTHISKSKTGKKQRIAPLPSLASTEPLRLSRNLEEVSIIVDAYDQADGNMARRRLGLYELGYQIVDADGKALPGFEQANMTIRFNHLPADEEAVKVAYAENSGITVHGNASTKFLYNVTNAIHDGHATIQFWKIKDLPAGEYQIRIVAKDYAGNLAVGKTSLRVVLD
ncbi:NHL repeat-containing protein [Undibacterium fentianense]|uniref:Gluconolaconase n=1 Tax=Undibacterium fentianense TaxID=2828728 RepID=A0A941DZQ7_9BURK|nr:NHL repeat-containing protein [Undibacterium fentianense]MBR7800514.1 gluconolaconase [Undibacterium fentianense]